MVVETNMADRQASEGYYGVDGVWAHWDKEWLDVVLDDDKGHRANKEEKWKWDETHPFRLTLTLHRVGGIGESRWGRLRGWGREGETEGGGGGGGKC